MREESYRGYHLDAIAVELPDGGWEPHVVVRQGRERLWESGPEPVCQTREAAERHALAVGRARIDAGTLRPADST